MKRVLAACVVVGALMVASVPANAEPGKANGGGWFEAVQMCDGEEVTIIAHGGVWSAVHTADGRRFIPVSQTIVDLRDNSVLFDLQKQGHSNQGPFVTCSSELPLDFFGFPTEVVAQGFWQPQSG
jgi:hypothetical protein